MQHRQKSWAWSIKPPQDVALYPGALLGLRAWRLDDSSSKLRAIAFSNHHWNPGVTKAACINNCPVTPNPVWDDSNTQLCRCGMHAYHDLNCLRQEQGHINDLDLVSGKVILGIVAGKGNAQVHRHGWRAEEAQVLGLLAPPNIKFVLCPECDGLGYAEVCLCRGTGLVNEAHLGPEYAVLASQARATSAPAPHTLLRESMAEMSAQTGKERVERVAEHYKVSTFKSYEEMMMFGRRWAEPAPEHLKVATQPFWSTDGFIHCILACWIIALCGAFITTTALTVGAFLSLFGRGVGGTLVDAFIAVIGLTLAALLTGVALHFLGKLCQVRMGKRWNAYNERLS